TNKSLLKLTKNLTTIKNKKATALTKPKQNQQKPKPVKKKQEQTGPKNLNNTIEITKTKPTTQHDL
ncbi:MAG: hypothetical protein QM571_01470, partial [Micrococcaceae bacterium]